MIVTNISLFYWNRSSVLEVFFCFKLKNLLSYHFSLLLVVCFVKLLC